jgi:ubiquinone/menaquinone biosynthesis C-methylase UbiE
MLFAGGEVDRLACPRCRGSLRQADDALVCSGCSAKYEVRAGVPDLLPWSGGEPGREWARWRKKLDLLQEWRQSTWDRSEQAETRQELVDELATRFFEFVRVPVGESVLEIGCGSGDFRRYLSRQSYWGLDPLFAAPAEAVGSAADGDSTTTFFFRGVGECLPLTDASFDAVLLCQTLDHCLDPAQVIREACRVLKPGGRLGIMQSLHVASSAAPAARLHAAAGKLKSRLLGRWRPDDADTKTNPLGPDELTALVKSELTVEADVTCGSVMFLRALKHEVSVSRAGRRESGG